jgi:hypothetical protein
MDNNKIKKATISIYFKRMFEIESPEEQQCYGEVQYGFQPFI